MPSLTAEQRIIELLRSLDEARVAYDARSRGGGVSLMPSDYAEGSYAELERCLIEMRESPERRLWWHVCSRHRWGEQRKICVTVERTRLGPKFRMPPYSELVAGGPASGERRAYITAYVWTADVDERKVKAGLDLLSSVMHEGRRDKIMLPRRLFRQRLGLAPIENDLPVVA